MSRVLVASPYGEAHKARLEQVFSAKELVYVDHKNRSRVLSEAARAEVAILKGTPSAEFLKMTGLRWVHCNQSGMDRCATDEFLQSDVHITCASGRSAATLAEHAIYFMLCHSNRAPDQWRAQSRKVWRARHMPVMRGLVGQRALVIGMGKTARALIPRLQSLQMEVDVFRRRHNTENAFGVPVYAQEAGHTVDDLLPEADFVILAASLNNSSFRMLGPRQFSLMKCSACLVNVARAEIVDKAALIQALTSQTIAGAGVDVTEPEPLPPWDALWRVPNIVITSHITPRVADRASAEIDIIENNWKRLLSGQPLQNKLEPRDKFDHSRIQSYTGLEKLVWKGWNSVMRPRARY